MTRQVQELYEAALEQARLGDVKEFKVQRIEWYRLMNSDLANPRNGAHYVVDVDDQTICGIPITIEREVHQK